MNKIVFWLDSQCQVLCLVSRKPVAADLPSRLDIPSDDVLQSPIQLA